MPVRVRNFHGEFMRNLSFAITGESLARHSPGVCAVLSRDNPDAHSSLQAVGETNPFVFLRGLGIWTATAPTAFAACNPASEEPEIRIPGKQFCGQGR